MDMWGMILMVPLMVFVAFVAPIWIIAHYATRWRTSKTMTADDEALLAELRADSERMEARIRNLERILDAEAPHWREQS